MDIKKERELISKKDSILEEISYREGILRMLEFDVIREKGFYKNFIVKFMKMKDTNPRVYWENNETFGKFHIDHDIELQKDITKVFEKSINKLKEEYKKL